MEKRNRKWLWLAPIGAGLVVGVLATLFPGAEAQTPPDNSSTPMRSRYYKVDINTVRGSILQIIPQ